MALTLSEFIIDRGVTWDKRIDLVTLREIATQHSCAKSLTKWLFFKKTLPFLNSLLSSTYSHLENWKHNLSLHKNLPQIFKQILGKVSPIPIPFFAQPLHQSCVSDRFTSFSWKSQKWQAGWTDSLMYSCNYARFSLVSEWKETDPRLCLHHKQKNTQKILNLHIYS